jgi:hypothetical protein
MTSTTVATAAAPINVTAQAQVGFPAVLATAAASINITSLIGATVGVPITGSATIPLTVTARAAGFGSATTGSGVITITAAGQAQQIISNISCVATIELITARGGHLWVTPIGFREGDVVVWWSA